MCLYTFQKECYKRLDIVNEILHRPHPPEVKFFAERGPTSKLWGQAKRVGPWFVEEWGLCSCDFGYFWWHLRCYTQTTLECDFDYHCKINGNGLWVNRMVNSCIGRCLSSLGISRFGSTEYQLTHSTDPQPYPARRRVGSAPFLSRKTQPISGKAFWEFPARFMSEDQEIGGRGEVQKGGGGGWSLEILVILCHTCAMSYLALVEDQGTFHKDPQSPKQTSLSQIVV